MSPINIRVITGTSLVQKVSRGNYGSLQEIINSNASLSPNEATGIGLSADGDVVRLIAALPRVSHATTQRFDDSDYDYMPYYSF